MAWGPFLTGRHATLVNFVYKEKPPAALERDIDGNVSYVVSKP